MSSHRHVNNML